MSHGSQTVVRVGCAEEEVVDEERMDELENDAEDVACDMVELATWLMLVMTGTPESVGVL